MTFFASSLNLLAATVANGLLITANGSEGCATQRNPGDIDCIPSVSYRNFKAFATEKVWALAPQVFWFSELS